MKRMFGRYGVTERQYSAFCGAAAPGRLAANVLVKPTTPQLSKMIRRHSMPPCTKPPCTKSPRVFSSKPFVTFRIPRFVPMLLANVTRLLGARPNAAALIWYKTHTGYPPPLGSRTSDGAVMQNGVKSGGLSAWFQVAV